MIYVAMDRSGIPRVFGQASRDDDARRECERAMQEYAIDHPEVGPVIDDWLIIPNDD